MSVEPDISELIADAVLATSGVAALHGGMFGEAATYLPGRRVFGIRIDEYGTEIHVSVLIGSPIRETADAVRLAVAPLSPGPVHVIVEDVVRA
ncbi:Asp23/Gls24 family envelope stress response protein [Rhodococcus sp. G-MC3]|uniref:Asp23/Gls24 family envelope stress response protein n=1 Tax=Rhodococcus sp. G-MC3 TaxID=3046209 RepID=UPI0024BABD42|nr:Asp23/Gls24 family envelope stress response protein [Rhodococcus sp. G-MC3]MDJ0393669.1 Asp23/Gls24 family envelope stress response protein [Rhodococcus sp. G-MC3]